MKIENKRKEEIPVTISLDSLEPGTIIFIKNRYLLLSEDIDTAIDLETGTFVRPPDEVFPNQILNNSKLVVE